MKTISLFFLNIFFLSINLVFAQKTDIPCQKSMVEERLAEQHPDYLLELERFYADIPRLETEGSHQERAVRVIPVVVHVIHQGTSIGVSHNLSESRVLNQIKVMNDDFRRKNTDANQTPAVFEDNAQDTQIEFELAAIDPNGNPTNGITRHQYSNVPNINYIEDVIKSQTYWNPAHYLNIWSVPPPEAENFILGYSYMPTNMILGTHQDGVVVVSSRFGVSGVSKGRTATHEVGHYLGLAHVFGPENNLSGCQNDDGISDTPNCENAYFGCPSFPRSSCNSVDMFMNYMDYVDDDCMNLFTFGQSNVMNSVLNIARSSLINNADNVLPVVDADWSAAIDFFPNPASNYFSIQIATDLGKSPITIRLMNTNGQVLQTIFNFDNERIDVSNLENGLYFVEIQVENKIFIKKMIVEK